MENQALSVQHSPDTSKPSEQHKRSEQQKREKLIREWVVRFALNAEKALGAEEQAVYLKMWSDGFADIPLDRLLAAFVACIRSHTFKTMPTIGDVRQHLTGAEAKADTFEAEQKWAQVLSYVRDHFHPDLQNYRAPRLSEHTDHAVRAAGGLAFINECSKESLQWAKKRFIEDYLAWTELDRGRFLLPQDSEIRAMFAEAAESKALLPATRRPIIPEAERQEFTLEELAEILGDGKDLDCTRERQEENWATHRESLARHEIRRAVYAPTPTGRSLEQQLRILREKGFLPSADLGLGKEQGAIR